MVLCIERKATRHQIMEASNSQRLNLLLLSVLLFPGALDAGASSTFGKGDNITDGEVRISNNGDFTLGFFSPGPGAPTKRYLGIWFTVSNDTVYWVANYGRPLTDTSGVLVVSNTGTLLLLDGSGQIAWSSNSTTTNSEVVAQLLDNGNLVLGNQGSSTILWQSFDHPTNTMLPGMKVGKSLWTGVEWYLTSWRSVSDPSPGAYCCVLETSGLPDFFVWKGNAKIYRTGPWNGRWFSGTPEDLWYTNLVTFEVSTSLGETSYGYVAKPGAPLSRLMVTDNGMVKRLVWDMSGRSWDTFSLGPRDVCDEYGKCGAFGLCDVNSAPYCTCLKGFSMSSTLGGCRRNIMLDCEAGGMSTTDSFLLVPGVKLPDTHNASVDNTITVEECRARCLANCSCLAYATADIRGGGSGCIIWTDSIIDLRSVVQGQDLYLKLAGSEFDEVRFPVVAVIAPVASSVAIVLLLLMIWWIRRHKLTGVAPQVPPMKISLPIRLSDLPTIKQATGDFSASREIGRGGFAVVYKGELADGTTIAVKRFNQSALTSKGRSDFTREVDVMARIRHGNLLRLLDHCNEGEECILIYPFMHNQSLDRYIFGNPSLRAALDWRQRLDIIHGVAQGVAYLHHGLEESVIHRDLKPHNVLLDDNFKPKVSDFNTAKLFDDNQPDTDSTLVLTPGYASPEYVQGELTLKCDVYSFGVMLLETLAGQKNGAAQRLLPHAWELWEQGTAVGLLDPTVSLPQSLPDSELISQLERCIKIGLLCVQEMPDDRPAMSDVVVMLTSKTSQIDRLNRPALHGRAGPPFREADLLSPTGSGNQLTYTDLQGR